MKLTRKILLICFIGLSLLLTGCSTEQSVVDREGNEVVIPKKLERIISTAPSNTEVLTGLGLGDNIVAIDNYSPTEGLNEDVVVIDFRNPDAETIIALNPDIIIASGHNKAGGEDPFKVIKEAGIAVVYLPSSPSFEDIYKDIEFLSGIFGEEKAGNKLIDGMKEEIQAIKDIAATITEKKKVYFEISPAPYIYTTGSNTFQNQMIEVIGATNIFAGEEGWVAASEEAIVSQNPDVILTNVGYVDNPTDEILAREGWKEINAVKDNHVYLIDSNSSSRPSQNIIKALKEMAKAVYPEYYE